MQGAATAEDGNDPLVRRDDLVPVVQRSLGTSDLRLDDWRCERVAYNEWNAVSGGLWRLSGNGEAPWSVILKVLRHPRGRSYPSREPLPPGWGEDVSHYNYWQREADAYASGSLASLAPGLRSPRCFGVTRRSTSQTWVWLEEITETEPRWTMQRYSRVARHLGRFGGGYLSGHPMPSGSWVSRDWLRGWSEDNWTRAIAALETDERSRDPLLARLCPAPTRRALLRFWSRRHLLYDVLSQMPSTFAHLDAFPSNLLSGGGSTGAESVAVDWGFAGTAAIGEEIVQLVTPSMLHLALPVAEGRKLEQAVLDGYAAGLEEAGWRVDISDVLFAYSAASALRWLLGPYWFAHRAVSDVDVRKMVEQLYDRPLDAAIEHLAEIQEFLLDLHSRAERSLSGR